jgi:hypothetical protein
MTSSHPIRVLLGPQSPRRTIGEAVSKAQLPDGPLAVISAGWQEAEGDIDDIGSLVDRPLQDLHLYSRSEYVLENNSSLADAVRQRQNKLLDLQRLYRMRLKQLSIAARRMLNAEGDTEIVAAEQRHAIAQLRALDRHHLHRCESVWQEFAAATGQHSHPLLRQNAAEVAEIIARCAGVLITGGNVGVLMNRMRLFSVERLLEQSNIIAWSAGAMVLTDRIVLFHDRSPEGRRDAEVFGAGSGVIPGHVFLPDAQHRLRTGDRPRMSLLCRRFAPAVCVALDSGTEAHFDDAGLRHSNELRRLGHDGRFATLRAS